MLDFLPVCSLSHSFVVEREIEIQSPPGKASSSSIEENCSEKRDPARLLAINLSTVGEIRPDSSPDPASLWPGDSFLSVVGDGRPVAGGFQLQFLARTSISFSGVAGFSISSVK